MPLILGTAQLGLAYGVNASGDCPSLNSALRVLDQAWAVGIRSLDTASSYGSSHRVIGAWHAANQGCTFAVRTKLSPNFSASCRTAIDVERLAQGYLNELRVDCLDELLCHRLADWQSDVMAEFLDSPSAVAHRFGVSVLGVHELPSVLNDRRCSAIQMPHNILDQRLSPDAFNRVASVGVAQNVTCRSVFLQGILLQPQRATQILGAERWHACESTLQTLAKAFNCESIAALCVAYCKALEGIHDLVIGADSGPQVLDAHYLYNLPGLTAEQIVVARAAVPRLSPDFLDPCRWPARACQTIR